MRCVIEGESPHKRPWDPDAEEGEDEESDDSEEEGLEKRKGVVYRLAKGQLKVLEGGIRGYEEMAARASLKLTKPKVAVVNMLSSNGCRSN